MHHLGIDGCKLGWFVATRRAGRLDFRLLPHISSVVEQFGHAARIFIDVPIGLPSQECPVRPCDTQARSLLGARRSSVFPVPCREALLATTLDRARSINRRQLGRSIAAQTWGISRKIAEVDVFLCAHPAYRNTIREIHPEVCFWALAGQRPMKHSKKSPEGRAERMETLRLYEPSIEIFLAEAMSQTQRKHVQADDVLDAAAALLTAEAKAGALSSVCGKASCDREGLPMDMLYLRTSERTPHRNVADAHREKSHA